MVLELNRAQLEIFAESYDQRMRVAFRDALHQGIEGGALDAYAAQAGISRDAAVTALYVACDRLGPETLESFVTHACIALEPETARKANPALFSVIDMFLARDTPKTDARLSVIRQHIAKTAPRDADATRLLTRITTCLGVRDE